MATIQPILIQPPRTLDQRGVFTVEWAPLTTTDLDGAAVQNARFSDRSVHVSGTFGAGGTVTVQGTNQTDAAGLPINWLPLSDPAGVALAITSASIKTVLQITRFIRPLVSGGDGTTSLKITLTSKGDDL